MWANSFYVNGTAKALHVQTTALAGFEKWHALYFRTCIGVSEFPFLFKGPFPRFYFLGCSPIVRLSA